jgi:hypothetical protein
LLAPSQLALLASLLQLSVALRVDRGLPTCELSFGVTYPIALCNRTLL